MLTIYTCLVDQHDWRLVAAAVAICVLGCLVSTALWEKVGGKTGESRAIWIGLAALTAAASVWSTHFVAMLAYEVRLERGLSVPLTAISFAAAFLLMIPTSMALGRARSNARMGALAGIAFTVAVAVMHYTGMAAYRTGARVIWDWDFIALSLIAGAGFSIAAAILFSSPNVWVARLATPVLLALGIASLHFTGMSAVTISPFPESTEIEAGLSGDWLPIATIAAIGVVLAGAAAALWNDRMELRRNAREMREARDRAEAETRLKSRFLAKMSHELRTPLNGVLGLTQVLRDTPLSDEQRDLVDTIYESGDALVAIVDDILDAARVEAKQIVLEQTSFDLKALVDDVIRLLTGQARPKGLELNATIAPDFQICRKGDAGRIRQILINLVGNAIKFTETGEVRIEVRSEPGNEMVAIAISDTGIGIAPDRQAAIFDPYAQADDSTTRRFGGTGLGLTICRELARLMDGDVDVESQVGQGATFHVRLRLPQAEDSTVPHAAPVDIPSDTQATSFSELLEKSIQSEETAQPRRILIVDDLRLNRLVVRKLLPSECFETREAENGSLALQAVEQARVEGRQFDVVIMDVSMPVMDGLAATSAIREAERSEHPADAPLRIVGLTAHAAPEDKARCRMAGMDEVLVKPARRDLLLEALVGLRP